MRKAPALALAVGVSVIAACDSNPSPIAPDAETVVAEAAPAGFGTCMPRALRDTQTGRLTPGSCLFDAGTGARIAYYEIDTPAAGEMLTLRVSPEFAGQYGIKEQKDDPSQGIVWGALGFSAGTPRTMSFIGSSPTQQVYVRGLDGSQKGAFDLEATVAPISHTCDRAWVLEAPVSFDEALDPARSCHWTIQFSPFPEAIGKPIIGQYYNAKLVPGHSYEIRVTGVTEAFNPALTVYWGGGVAAQSVGEVPVDGALTVVVTPEVLGYWGIEVSNGQPDGEGGWITPGGSFTLSVTPL